MKPLKHVVLVLFVLLGAMGFAPTFGDDLEGLTADMRPVDGTGFKGRGRVSYFATEGDGVQAWLNHKQCYLIGEANEDLGMTYSDAETADVELWLSDVNGPYARCQLHFYDILESPNPDVAGDHAVYKLTARITRNGTLVGGPCVAVQPDIEVDPDDALPQDKIFPEIKAADTAWGVVVVNGLPTAALTGVLED